VGVPGAGSRICARPRLRYVLICRNYGESAGAHLEHAHSQLIALPVVPKRVQEEIEGASRYYHAKSAVFSAI